MVRCTLLAKQIRRRGERVFLASLVLLSGLFFVPHDLPRAEKGTGSAFKETDLAVIRFSSPQQFALLLHEAEPAPRLYKVGDVLVHPGDTVRLLVLERVQKNRLVLHEKETGRRWSLQSNRAVPVLEGLFFLRTMLLTEIRYRFEASNQIIREAPVVLSLSGSRAVLKQQVPFTGAGRDSAGSIGLSILAPRKRGDRATAPGISPRRLGENSYEVDKGALAPILKKLSKKVAEGLRDITRAFLNGGPMLPLQSSVGDGVLTKAGFTVTHPKIARTFGIEVGDTIVSLNGKQVSSPLNAWWTFQEVMIRDQTTTVRVNLVRAGKPLTKTYRIK